VSAAIKIDAGMKKSWLLFQVNFGWPVDACDHCGILLRFHFQLNGFRHLFTQVFVQILHGDDSRIGDCFEQEMSEVPVLDAFAFPGFLILAA
jgi:hypothetical protein